jgi:hypothetical protein
MLTKCPHHQQHPTAASVNLAVINSLVLALCADLRAIFEQNPWDGQQSQGDKAEETAGPIYSELVVHYISQQLLRFSIPNTLERKDLL